MMKNIGKRGYTDKLYLFNLISVWLYTILCVILTCLGQRIGIDDYSFVSVVCPLIWGELAVHSAYMIKKAWLENLNKHKLVDKDNIGEIQ